MCTRACARFIGCEPEQGTLNYISFFSSSHLRFVYPFRLRIDPIYNNTVKFSLFPFFISHFYLLLRFSNYFQMNLLVVLALIKFASGDPGGLLRVPKVYNAVITSNQNLSPSRAYPVIQPVIHRTAIGYVPPVYYTQVAPHLAGPEVVHLSQRVLKQPSDVQTAPSSPSVERSKSTDKTESTSPNVEEEEEEEGEVSKSRSKGKSGDQEPLSFYPNYQSLYYDPYFYTYSGFNPHLVPGTYYVDYQPYGTLEPIPATTPRNGLAEHLLPAYHEEKKLSGKDEKERIPDVPPPPLPTAVPKSS